jgi:hypothetical protein
MKETYYTLENNTLRKVGSVIRTAKGWVTNPSAEDCAAIGAYPRSKESFAPPKCDEGYHAVADGYDLKDGKWVKKWRIEPTQYTYDDYDNAMEDYIHQVAVDRGYTRREPSSYDDDPYPRFAQDAKDFKAFRSQVMLYALPILNEYLATGNAPTLAEFKAGFPKIMWTYQDAPEESQKKQCVK